MATHSNLLISQKRTLRSREDTWLCTPSLSGLVAELELDPTCLIACLSAGGSSLQAWPFPLASLVTLTDQGKTWQPGKKAPQLYAMAQGKPAHFIRFCSLPLPPPPNMQLSVDIFLCSNHRNCPEYRDCGLELILFAECCCSAMRGNKDIGNCCRRIRLPGR